MKFKQILIASVVVVAGCSATNYPCGEPSSGKCLSVTDNYERSYTNYTNPDDLDAGSSSKASSSSSSKPTQMSFRSYAQTPSDGAPLLSAPKMIRIWLTPYTDNDNIYHDQSYEYVIVNRGSWNFNNNKSLLNDDAGLKNVTASQVSTRSGEGYGGYGVASQPIKPSNPSTPANPIANLSQFPAINSLQTGQAPIVTTTSIGSGIDKTTTITP